MALVYNPATDEFEEENVYERLKADMRAQHAGKIPHPDPGVDRPSDDELGALPPHPEDEGGVVDVETHGGFVVGQAVERRRPDGSWVDSVVVELTATGTIICKDLDRPLEGVMVTAQALRSVDQVPAAGHVIEPPESPAPAVLPTFAQEFIAQGERAEALASTPAEEQAGVVPEKMVLFWRRAFEFYVTEGYRGLQDGSRRAKVWVERFKHAVAVFRQEHDQVRAEKLAFLNFTPIVCWETNCLVKKKDPAGRAFELVNYGWWDWPEGKPRVPFSFWMPPGSTVGESPIRSPLTGAVVPVEQAAKPADEDQGTFWQTMKAGLGAGLRRQ